jgi:hypothetical protein
MPPSCAKSTSGFFRSSCRFCWTISFSLVYVLQLGLFPSAIGQVSCLASGCSIFINASQVLSVLHLCLRDSNRDTSVSGFSKRSALLIFLTDLVGTQYSWLSSIVYVAQLIWQPMSSYFLVRLPLSKYCESHVGRAVSNVADFVPSIFPRPDVGCRCGINRCRA